MGRFKKKKTKGKRKSKTNPSSSIGKDIAFLSKCKNSKKRAAFLKKCPRRLALQNRVQKGCAQLVQKGGRQIANVRLRKKLAKRKVRIKRAARSKKAAYKILQQGGNFLSDIWGGIKELLGI